MNSPDQANPKDAAGRAKLPLHLWPASATAFGSIGLLEGELKYGRNNFRATDVAASVYVAALRRHIDDWMEGAENADDTGSPHLGNALACLAIIVDAQVNGTLIDDRNFVPQAGAYGRLVAMLTAQSVKLKAMFGDSTPKHYDKRDEETNQADQSGLPDLTEPQAYTGIDTRAAAKGVQLARLARLGVIHAGEIIEISHAEADLLAGGMDFDIVMRRRGVQK